ncbi:28S ribosomal protein S5, mitochondrial [Rhizoclosmatium hyalinum]|nr:28S ribosomal protein S5, mitochondrial [Rhizoclosmatium hyalinum]
MFTLFRRIPIATHSTATVRHFSSETTSAAAIATIADDAADLSSANAVLPKTMGPALQKRVLAVRRVARSTKGGKIRSISAMVVVGNGNGVGGFGEGRASDLAAAVTKATNIAIKNMTPIARFQQRTVFGDIVHQYHSVKLDIKTAPPGFGIVANNPIHEICRCVGIRDLAAKVRGSLNTINVIKGTFEALQLQKTPTQIAQARGRKLVDIANAYYGGKK